MRGESEARDWVAAEYDVPRETMDRLDGFAALLRDENGRQNLVSSNSLEALWIRHIADSAQLLAFRPQPTDPWLDLGSGAGFPGLVVATLGAVAVTLVEERRLRTEFLAKAARLLEIEVEIAAIRIERLPARPFATISARAFAPLGRLFELAERFSTEKTVWILPKGRNAQSELDAVAGTWQGDFRLEPSLTDPDACIIVATGVSRRQTRSRRA